jgi:Uma2 family endonuclease
MASEEDAMGRPEQNRNRYTYADYATWPEGERWELVDGTPYAMTPSPSTSHQRIALGLASELRRCLEGRRCEALAAPMDVKLSEEDVVQPDVFVYCDPTQDKGSHIEGAPVLVVEVVSPSSGVHDRMRKLHLYARFGVREYWIVSPADQLVEVLTLTSGVYSVACVFGRGDELTSPQLPDVRIDLSGIFTDPPPPDQVREGVPPYGRPVADAPQ